MYQYKVVKFNIILTFPIVEMEFDGFALIDVKICEPNGKHKQNEQQKELELCADLLQRKAHSHHRNITHSVENSGVRLVLIWSRTQYK